MWGNTVHEAKLINVKNAQNVFSLNPFLSKTSPLNE